MKLFFNSQFKMVDAALAAALLAVSKETACTYAHNSSAPTVTGQALAPADLELAARVKAALHADPNFYDRHVEVSIEKGNVVLTGLVQNSRELLYALQIATNAAEGRKVVDELTIFRDPSR